MQSDGIPGIQRSPDRRFYRRRRLLRLVEGPDPPNRDATRTWRPPRLHLLVRALERVLAAFGCVLVALLTIAAVDAPVSTARGPVSLQAVSASVGPDGHTVSVTAQLANYERVPHAARAWWALSAPGLRPTWQHQVYQSRVYALHLGPLGRATLRWTEDARVANGFYTLSVWVHFQGSRGIFVHSDGKELRPVLITAATSPAP
jgi:hypothetical protein